MSPWLVSSGAGLNHKFRVGKINIISLDGNNVVERQTTQFSFKKEDFAVCSNGYHSLTGKGCELYCYFRNEKLLEDDENPHIPFAMSTAYKETLKLQQARLIRALSINSDLPKIRSFFGEIVCETGILVHRLH